MSLLLQVIFFSLVGGVISLIGGVILLSNKDRAQKLAEYATPFAAGALLAAAFTDLLPEAAKVGDIDQALLYALLGVLIFFLMERFLHWFHHHHEHDDHEHMADPNVSLIVLGDTLHNFIDGIAIAAGFLVDSSTGIIVTLAVAAHEIPQEIGDFGLLIKKGMSRNRVLQVNVMSALATTVAAVTFYLLGDRIDIPLAPVLGLIAGFFIYIAASDIIPSIHKHDEKNGANIQTLLLIVGVIVVSVTTSYLHEYIDAEHEHDDVHAGEYEDHDGHEH